MLRDGVGVDSIMPFHLWPTGPHTRRDFLAGMVVGGASLTLKSGEAAARDDPDEWFALLSDTHIATDPSAIVRGEKMADNLRAVVVDILASPRMPVGLLINGDLALTDGRPGDYTTLLSLLEPIREAKIPIHFTLGNHDDRTHFRESMKAMIPAVSQVEAKYVDSFNALGRRFVLLDSLDQVNHAEGSLGPTQLAWFMRELDADKTRQTLVFVHHNPISDKVPGLIDHEALFGAVQGRPWVRAIFYGHTHTWAHLRVKGLRLVNLPPVAYTFAEKQPIGYCRFVVRDGRARVQLRAIAGDKTKDDESFVMRRQSL